MRNIGSVDDWMLGLNFGLFGWLGSSWRSESHVVKLKQKHFHYYCWEFRTDVVEWTSYFYPGRGTHLCLNFLKSCHRLCRSKQSHKEKATKYLCISLITPTTQMLSSGLETICQLPLYSVKYILLSLGCPFGRGSTYNLLELRTYLSCH